ncbi:signal peptidase II [Butyrivibrio sp. LB2008]|uniref:signal peptidase II n=1 Tax=Butyrivibrio sp. LB2008 TaxID=1408305 RepID=UPI0004794343|nr:signal peptidase II [Butyrivibrio sp. LB2008]
MNTNLSKKKKLFLLADFVLIIVLILFDQFTKHLALVNLQDKPFKIIDGVLEFNYLQNTGAAFGILQNQKVFFVLIAAIMLIVIAYVLFRMPDDKKYNAMHILLVLVASGAAGNMIDRVKNDYVIDFIYFVIINFPIFNVADIYVTVATFAFAYLLIFYYKDNDFEFLSFKQQKKFKEFK